MNKSLIGLTSLMAVMMATHCLAETPPKKEPNPPAHTKRKSSEPANLKLPTGFSGSIVAEDLGPARHIAISKTGDIYVKLAKLKDGKGIYRLRDTNHDGTVDDQMGFGDYPGTGICIKNGYLYASSNSSVYRYKLNDQQDVIDPDKPELLVSGLRETDRDKSKSIAIDNQGNLYVNIASDNDACREKGTGKGMMPCPLLDSAAGIWRFKADGANQQFADGTRYATGLKNVVGLDWNDKANSLFVMQHGRGKFDDFYPQYYTPKMSAELPAETMFEVHQGDDAGWPYIYYDPVQKKKILAPEYGGDGKKMGTAKTIDPIAAFPAHLGPNSLLFYTGTAFPARYQNGAFIAFHAQSQSIHKGYMVGLCAVQKWQAVGSVGDFCRQLRGH